MTTAGRLPFTLTPLPGESVEVWACTYATRLRLSIRELLTTLGLPRPVHGRWQRPALTEAVTQRIRTATGLAPAHVAGMFTTTGHIPQAAMLTAWSPQPASRFCPACLTDGTGWVANWRLRLQFFCLRHDAPLAEHCPKCGASPHGSLLRPTAWPGAPPEPANLTPAPFTQTTTRCRCGYDLTSTDPAYCPAPDAWAHTQRLIDALLVKIRDPAGSIVSRQEALDELADLTLITAHLATLHGRSRQPEPAIRMLQGDTLTQAAALLRHDASAGPDLLLDLVDDYATGRTAKAIPHTWNRASPALRTRISYARAEAGSLTPLDRMRYATSLPIPRLLPPKTTGMIDPAARRARQIPDQLWPGWAIRLADDDNLEPSTFRIAAAVALLLPHSDLQLKTQIIPLLNDAVTPNAVHHQIGHLLRMPGGDTGLRLLTELAFALDKHDTPIDYARRRELTARTRLITPRAWERIAQKFPGGRGQTLPNARRYLYELITGGSLRIAPAPYRRENAATRWDHYAAFVTYMPHGMTAALDQHARNVLDEAGITGEPVSWEPPTDWVSTTAWPGTDPALTDPASIHHAILEDRLSIQAIAAERGTSVEHIRTVLRLHPLPSTGKPLPKRSRKILAPDPNAPHRDPAEGTFHVDPDWLRQEYATWHRSLPDIAAEIGCTLAALTQFARTHHIRLRDGAPTHDSIDRHALGNRHPSEIPLPLRDALRGLHTRLRLERFLTIATQPSLTQAATLIGCSQGNLSVQLGILERAIGTKLLHRDHRTRVVAGLTPTGQQLYDQAREYLAIEPLDAPDGRGGTATHLPSNTTENTPETSRSAPPPRQEGAAPS